MRYRLDEKCLLFVIDKYTQGDMKSQGFQKNAKKEKDVIAWQYECRLNFGQKQKKRKGDLS